jgi:acetyl-CoA C-acetyltransferase
MPRVAILGVGCLPAQRTSAGQSFKEMMFDAAQRAYLDAGLSFRDVDSFVTCAEDLNEGISIFDEYTPDQLGAVLKPMHTVTGDGLHGIADGVMQILSGLAEVVVVEAHSKSSNVLTPHWVLDYALDPVLNRPLGFHAHVIAALEMSGLLDGAGVLRQACSRVVSKNRANALGNPLAAYAAGLAEEDVDASPQVCSPLHERDIAQPADGCVVVVLAHERRVPARSTSTPVWVTGVGFANDSPTLESRNWTRAVYAETAARMAYRQAGIVDPAREVDLFEVDDSYAYKELQHLVALGVCADPVAAAAATLRGETAIDGRQPVNVSGGCLGLGTTLEANGLYRVVELVHQLRGHAGARQVENARVAVAQSWRGVPTTSGAVAVLSAA